METREQTIQKIEFFIKMLTDKQLKMVSGFIRGILRGSGNG